MPQNYCLTCPLSSRAAVEGGVAVTCGCSRIAIKIPREKLSKKCLVEVGHHAGVCADGVHVVRVRVWGEGTHVVLTPVGARKVHGRARAPRD